MTSDDRNLILPRDLIPAATLCAACFAAALASAISLGLSGTDLLAVYYVGTVFPTIFVLLWWSILLRWRGREYAGMAPRVAVQHMLKKRWLLLTFPLLLTPTFDTAYTVAKTCFPYYVGFRWDEAFASLDRALFGVDPWRLTHAVLGPAATDVLGWFYLIGWGIVLGLVFPAMLFFAQPRNAIRAHLAFMLVWFFGGVVGAAIFSSAGPAFAGLSTPALGDHFHPLIASLDHLLPPLNGVLMSQEYLRHTYGTLTVVKGAGISAMPSMHLSTAALYAVMAYRTRFFIPAVLFWIVIWITSVHLGYHYAVDGIAGIGVALAAWRVTAPRAEAVVRDASPQFALA